MSRFRIPTRPYWLPIMKDDEVDFYLRDAMRHNGHYLENLTPAAAEQYTSFLNQSNVLHVWNTLTNTTIPLPIIVLDCLATSTRMPSRRKSVVEVYEEDYCYKVQFPFSPIVADVFERFHPLEVCAVRILIPSLESSTID